MVWTGLGDQRIMKALVLFPLDELLKRRLIIKVPGASYRNITQNQPVDDSLRRLKAAVHVACRNDGLHRVRHDRVALSAAAVVLAVAEQEEIAQMDRPGRLGKVRLADEVRANSREFPLGLFRKTPVEIVRHDKAQNRVAQKLQPLIVRKPALAVLVCVRAVRQRVFEQLPVLKNISQSFFKTSVHAPTPSEPSSVPHLREYHR